MLTRLWVKNFLLVREAELEFCPHLNVLTGETGTGKSILLDALGLALGRRGSPKWIGGAGPALRVEATFRADRSVARQLRAMGVPLESSEVFLMRELRSGGDGRCFINGHRVLQRGLRKIGQQLVEIHGQRQEERFRLPEVQRDLLDLFGDLGDLRRQLRELFKEAAAREQDLAEHRRQIARLVQEEDWVRFQLREIEDLAPAADEIEALRDQVRLARAGAARAEWLSLADQLLNGREGAVLESLETLDARAATLPDADPPWETAREELRSLLGGARRLLRHLRQLSGYAAESGDDLDVLEQRLAQLEHLQRKHRRPLAGVLEAAAEMRAGLAALEEGNRREVELREALQAAQRALAACGVQLREARGKAARPMRAALQRELAALGMRGCRLEIRQESLAAPGAGTMTLPEGLVVGPAGAERIHFAAETNPGTGFRPLGEVASGGEMARIALALRVVLGSRGRAQLAVFDEIDAGLGATAARDVARRLQQVAAHRQVLLVTHLPVIAAAGERHFKVWKGKRNGHPVATTEVVTAEDRVGEVARMLSGDACDPRARAHAAALLTDGQVRQSSPARRNPLPSGS